MHKLTTIEKNKVSEKKKMNKMMFKENVINKNGINKHIMKIILFSFKIENIDFFHVHLCVTFISIFCALLYIFKII